MTPKVKVVRILTRLNIGGPSVHAALLATQLDLNRYTTCLVAGRPEPQEGDRFEELKGKGVSCIRVQALGRSPHLLRDLIAFFKIIRILRRERPQILHTHMAKAGTLGRLAGMIHNRMGGRSILIHTFHGHVLEGYFSDRLTRVFLQIERWLARRTDRLIAVSPLIRDDLLKKGIGRLDQWEVIPLGLDLSNLSELPYPNGTSMIRCGLVGRLIPIKNPSLFLEGIFRFLKIQDSRLIRAMVIGDGPLRESLENEVRLKGIEKIVQFTGWEQDPASIYKGLDVVCLTSWNEGTPVSLIEAMASGRAVVATDVGGVRDLLDGSGRNRTSIGAGEFQATRRGILVPPGDPDSLAAALCAMANDPNLRRSFGEEGRSYALNEFNSPRLIRDISSLYERVAGGL